MKTTILLSCALAAALAACADKTPPPQSPSSAPADPTTVSSTYTPPPAPVTTPADSLKEAEQPPLNEPEAKAKPVQPTTHERAAKSATDQGEGTSEVKITAHIRQAMMVSKTLSFKAKNVRIVTQGTRVTLTGHVKTEAEKKEIEGIARDTEGVQDVDDQLIVQK